MPLRKRLQTFFRAVPPKQPLVAIRPHLIDAAARIAEQENSTVVEIVNDLLTHALSERRTANAQLLVWQQLTHREREITALIWLGLTNPQIAHRLSISPNTVKTHIRNILTKFDVHGKEALRDKLQLLDLSDWLDV